MSDYASHTMTVNSRVKVVGGRFSSHKHLRNQKGTVVDRQTELGSRTLFFTVAFDNDFEPELFTADSLRLVKTPLQFDGIEEGSRVKVFPNPFLSLLFTKPRKLEARIGIVKQVDKDIYSVEFEQGHPGPVRLKAKHLQRIA